MLLEAVRDLQQQIGQALAEPALIFLVANCLSIYLIREDLARVAANCKTSLPDDWLVTAHSVHGKAVNSIGLIFAHINRLRRVYEVRNVHAIAKGEECHERWWRVRTNERVRKLQSEVNVAFDNPFHAQLPDKVEFFAPVSPTSSELGDFDDGQNDDDGQNVSHGNLALKSKLLHEILVLHYGAPRLFRRFLVQANRTSVFDSSCETIASVSPPAVLSGMHVQFRGEAGVEKGVDFGGLRKEWFDSLCSQLVSSESAFASSTSVPSGYSNINAPPGRVSSVVGTGEAMFRQMQDGNMQLEPSSRPPLHYFILGKMFAMSLIYACIGGSNTCHISLHLTLALLKSIVKKPLLASDVRSLDPVYYKNRMELMLAEGGVELMADCLGLDDGLHFVTYDEATGGAAEELVEGGSTRRVTSDNVSEYIELLCEHRLCGRVRKEISEFLAGFYSLVPAMMLEAASMDELDLALLISGVEEICVTDWQQHTTGTAVTRCPQLVSWFWDVMEEVSAVDRARVLHFATGCSKLPPTGFRTVGFKIDIMDGVDATHLPTAHTCFNTIGLPLYSSKEQLCGKLMAAVPYGNAGNWLM
jgi:hypothetical protein